MRVFKSLPPDALHNIRQQLEAADRPQAAALEAAAHLINAHETYKDALKSGLVTRLTGSDLVEFIERMRRDRLNVDASRRTQDKQAKKSQLRADDAHETTDEWLSEQLQDFMQGRTAWQNNGVALISLGDIVALSGGDFDKWLHNERTNPIVARDTSSRAGTFAASLHQQAEAA
ncbi:MAG TPA: hypothetical protein VLC93_02940 [Myxococcota bacterium]|nr:hypothetical protein [Myxococcota bacterium]